MYAGIGVQQPRFAGWCLAVAEALADGPREVAVVGASGHPATAALWRAAFAGAKQVLDPQGIMNPGVLVDPQGRAVGITGATA